MSSRLALIVLLSATALADELAVDEKASSLRYHMTHKLHRFEGVSHAVEGRARFERGQAQVAVRVPVASFDSANVNRDAHMKEVMEEARYPFVELKAASELSPPEKFPSTKEQKWAAQLSLHGVKKTLELPVKLTWESPERVRAETRFTISLEAYGIERPSLMFARVDDAVAIEAVIVWGHVPPKISQ
jgi:polyisoprenoid-binding protein YceI